MAYLVVNMHYIALLIKSKKLFFARECMTLNQLTNYKKRFINYDLVILNELGYLTFDKQGSELLFNSLSMRNETKSIIITTNLLLIGGKKYFLIQP